MEQRNVARTTNYLFVFDKQRDNTFAVQSSSVADLDLGETPFGAQPKDLYVPSNKITSAPVVVQFLLSEDHREWIEMYKWMLAIKNSLGSPYPDLVRTCELMALDSQNQPATKFLYFDCFPINISAIQYTSLGESDALTFDVTLRYNRFRVVTPSGEIIDEDYGSS